MFASILLSIGLSIIGDIGYGMAALFLLISALALFSAIFRARAQEKFNRRMNAFVLAAFIAFVLALLTTICLKFIA